MVRSIAGVLFLMAVAGCASQRAEPGSPYYVFPAGTRMELLQPIEIPAPGVSVWLQEGRVLTRNRDRYEPACKLEMRKRPDIGRTVTPDIFTVTRVTQENEAVALDTPLRRVVNRDDDGPMAYDMRTVFYLESARQPELYRLTCAHWDRPAFPRYLTMGQIEATLAGLFRITPAPSD